ncbi:MAG: hypothetical protein DWH79_02430 [Planctomycetota bacterium]|nr:MAG: hypothetical protein DWH79_02430 [Planctomycetota bacterium]
MTVVMVMTVMSVMPAMTGCGGGVKKPKVYPATGTVTLGGKPLADATVSFVPSVGAPSDGRSDAAGKFTIMTNGKPGAALGQNKVTVSKFSGAAPTMPAAPTPDDMKKMYEKKKKGDREKGDVPEKYGRPDTSGLSAEVTTDGSKNVYTFELQD